MEEYMGTETVEESTDMTELTDTVSGNDAGMADSGSSAPEGTVENDAGQNGTQDGLLESINALVEALTPTEEDVEEGTETEAETEAVPSETETAILELLECIYAETAESRTADTLYYEAWTESQTASQERADTHFSYSFVTLVALMFLLAVLDGLLIARTVWDRFK